LVRPVQSELNISVVQEVFGQLAIMGGKLQRPGQQALIAFDKQVFVAAGCRFPKLKHGSKYKTFGRELT